jgi:hypothetical protein
MKNLKGTKTHESLKAAFAAESQANRRYLYYARTADIEGHPDLGASSGTPRRPRPGTRSATSTS